MKTILLTTIAIFISFGFAMEKTVKVKLVNRCSYDIGVSCPGYSLMIPANGYDNSYLPVSTGISVRRYGSSDTMDKIYLEEKDAGREIVVCK